MQWRCVSYLVIRNSVLLTKFVLAIAKRGLIYNQTIVAHTNKPLSISRCDSSFPSKPNIDLLEPIATNLITKTKTYPITENDEVKRVSNCLY